jgi:hypothetical protein
MAEQYDAVWIGPGFLPQGFRSTDDILGGDSRDAKIIAIPLTIEPQPV